jgi:hypothetical protein
MYGESVDSESVELIESKSIDTMSDLADEIEKAFRKYFPYSLITAEYTTRLSPFISIDIALATSKKDVVNRIFENDPMYGTYFVWGKDAVNKEDGSIINNTLELDQSSGVRIKTKEPQWTKMALRKTKGDPQRILNAFDRHFKRLSEIIKNNADNLEGTTLSGEEILKLVK